MYEVVWMPSAERNLATIWTETSSRSAVTSAAKTIDSELTRWPQEFGEARAGISRVAFEPPLAVIFDVNLTDRIVLVLRVFQYGEIPDV